MANYRGMDGSVTFASNVVSEVKAWEVTTRIGVLNDTVLGDVWDTHRGARGSWSGTLTCQLDYGDTTGQKLAIDDILAATPTGDSITVNLRLSATKYISGSIIITGVDTRVELDNIVQVTLPFIGTGAAAISWA